LDPYAVETFTISKVVSGGHQKTFNEFLGIKGRMCHS